MDAAMKKSLAAPIKQLTNYVYGTKNGRRGSVKNTPAVRRKSIARRQSVVRRKSAPCTSQKVPDSWLRVYQADLQRERYGDGNK